MKIDSLYGLIVQTSTTEISDLMRRDDKIYIIVVALLMVFGAMSFYMLFLDRKIRQVAERSQTQQTNEELHTDEQKSGA